ncbi:MAG: lipopolysaccharide biosynthesis protein [Methylobacteriaceae bacterium]|nr:lipopolysaccharide biosynthesis protein [Methylobacteriaceae bacterium]
MLLVALFLASAAMSFALSLVVAALLGPAEFGRYTVALAAAVALNTVLFEWLRLSLTRFYERPPAGARSPVRDALERAYVAGFALLALGTTVAAFAGWTFGLPPLLLAATVAGAVALALLDYFAVLARARFDDRAYATLVLGRGFSSLALASLAALSTGDATTVLAASSASALLAIAAVRPRLADGRGANPGASGGSLGACARYALPIVAASAVYALIPLLNRSALAARSGFEEAGLLGLGSEIVTRLFQNLGSALDIVLFQLAVRIEQTEGRAAAEAQVARNLAAVVAVVVPAAAGLWLVWPSFEAVFIPPAFRGRLDPMMTLLIPALAACVLAQYAVAPVFQLQRRTAPVILAGLAALAANSVIVAFGDLAGAQDFAAAQLVGFGVGLTTLLGLALIAGAQLPWRDLAGAALATGLMALVLWPVRTVAPGLTMLSVEVALGASVYGAIAVASDLAGLRAWLRSVRRHSK